MLGDIKFQDPSKDGNHVITTHNINEGDDKRDVCPECQLGCIKVVGRCDLSRSEECDKKCCPRHMEVKQCEKCGWED